MFKDTLVYVSLKNVVSQIRIIVKCNVKMFGNKN